MQKYKFSQEAMPSVFPVYVDSVDVQQERKKISNKKEKKKKIGSMLLFAGL